jgi:O-antigen/teichoic acid export membrane protein
MGGQLALVPVLLQYWGTQRYGEWLALSAAVSYLTTLDFGMQSYVINRLNQAHTLGKRDEYNRILQTGLLVNTAVPAAGLLIIVPILILAGSRGWLHLHATSPSSAIWVASLLSFQAAFSITSGLLGGIYRTTGEYPRGQMMSNARLAALLILSLATVIAGGGLQALAAVQAVVGLLFGAAVYIDVSRRFPEISIGFSGADWRLAATFLAPSSMFFGLQMVAVFAVQGTTLMVNGLFGAAVLVVFASLRTVSNLIRQAAATIQQAVWPEFTSLDARPQGDALRQLHLLTAKLVMLVAICGSVFIFMVGDRLVAFWTRGRVQYDPVLMIALLVYACVQCHSFVSAVLLTACNRQGPVLQQSAMGTVTGFGLGYALSFRYGVSGFVFGLAIGEAIFCGIGFPWMASRMIGESLRRFFMQVTLRSFLLFAAIYGGVEIVSPWLRKVHGDANHLIWTAVATSVFGGAAAYAMTLDSRERGRVRATIFGFLTR